VVAAPEQIVATIELAGRPEHAVPGGACGLAARDDTTDAGTSLASASSGA